MKIRVVLPTLRSGGKFAAVLQQMRDFSSDKHEISWNVVCNDDDADTLARMPSWVHCWAGSAMVPYVARCNQAAAGGEFDWLMWWADDIWTLTPHWDEYIAALDPVAVPLISWQCTEEPNGFAVAVMTPKFMQALIEPYVPWFPYWFTDSWSDEVYRMAFGTAVPFVAGLECHGKRGKTRLMRDLRFWSEFFRRTRPDRMAQARRVKSAFGLDAEISAEQLAKFDEFDRWYASRIPAFEARFQIKDEPVPPHYAAMRAAAEAHLQDLQRLAA